ncbi:hypothetical protein KIH74_18080 [Kineosporia sp. J2-2]|uniref:Uncharacterized protein n=1 Tax=Kineosporia corallincola TaxID=2835133 RepID=A0ABS5TID8_9ACTN|nr:hypothetical protein [Kineosporia corallincola]MBT0770857.1 hypothetical protein [Kineosporia corallincola]
MSTDFFENRATSFESARRGLERPGDRDRSRTTGDTGAQPAVRPQLLPPRTITWGTTIKISMAIYFALMGVLVTLVLLTLLAARFAMDQIDEVRYDWRGLPGTSQTVE